MITAHISETYPPNIDGVGRVMQAYCTEMTAKGHPSWYIAPRDKHNTEIEGLNTLLYQGIPIPRQKVRFGFPKADKDFFQKLHALHPDVIHAHSPMISGHFALSYARKAGIPIVATFHSKYMDDFRRATHFEPLVKNLLNYIIRFFNSCDEVWTMNLGTAETMRSYGYRGEIVIMPNGTNHVEVSDTAYSRHISALRLKSDIPLLLFVGQVDYKKNPQLILKACKLIKESGKPFQLIIVGAGQDYKRLMHMSEQYGLNDSVRFLGFVEDHETLLSYYRRADLFVFPSVYDNAPMVVREAAAMGTPSLLIRGSCAAEGVTHNKNGFLCEATAESLRDGILDALPLAPLVGIEAQRTIPLPWSDIVQQALDRYAALIARKAR